MIRKIHHFTLGVASILLLVAFSGITWTPLSQVCRIFQKCLGATALLCLLLYVLWPAFRQACLSLSEKFNSLSDGDHRYFIRLFFIGAGALLSFATIYRHQSLQSGTFDLGIYANVTWNFANGNGFYHPVLGLDSFLGDHWQPILILFAPFFHLVDGPILFLLVQGFGIALGGYGLYRIGLEIIGRRDWSLLCAILFLLHRDVHKINRFHFHPDALGFFILIWALYFLMKNRYLWASLLVFTCWFIKEDYPVFTFALGFVSLWICKDKRWGVAVMGLSVVVFGLIIGVLIPHFTSAESLTHLGRYANLGETPGEIIRTIFLAPHKVIWDILSDKWFWEVPKRYLPPYILLPVLSPIHMLGAIISWSPHMLSGYGPQRSLQCQYGVSVICFLGVGAVYTLGRFIKKPTGIYAIGKKFIKPGPLFFFFLMLPIFSFGVPRYFRPESSERIQKFHEIKEKIPADARLVVQDHLGPHLSYRKTLRIFPNSLDGEYIFLDTQGNRWPMSDEEYNSKLDFVIQSQHYDTVHDEMGFILLKLKDTKKPLSFEEEDSEVF